MKKITQIIWLVPVIAAMGCSAKYDFSQNTSYENQPRLQIPAGLSEAKMQDLYPILGAGNAETIPTVVSAFPPGSRIGEYKNKK